LLPNHTLGAIGQLSSYSASLQPRNPISAAARSAGNSLNASVGTLRPLLRQSHKKVFLRALKAGSGGHSIWPPAEEAAWSSAHWPSVARRGGLTRSLTQRVRHVHLAPHSLSEAK
jgi:hypothetical protein